MDSIDRSSAETGGSLRSGERRQQTGVGELRLSRRQYVQAAAGVGATAGVGMAQAAEADPPWIYATGDWVESSPTVVDGTVYVGSADTNVYAIDAMSGDRQWRFETGDWVESSPTVVDGTVYVGGHDTVLYALDAAEGTEQWRFATGGAVTSSPTVVDGTVYVGSRDNTLYALDATTGDEQWTFETDGPIDTSPTVLDERVYIGSADGTVYALDAVGGAEWWRFETGDAVVSSPTVSDGIVYVGSNDDNLYALGAAGGIEQWRFETGNIVVSSPTVKDGTVYVGSKDHNLYALAAADGTERWRFETEAGVRSSPTIADGTVYVGSDDHNLYALAAADGGKQWFYQTGDWVPSSPLVVDGVVYFGGRDHNVYALNKDVSGSSAGSRARLGTLGHHDGWRYAVPADDTTTTAGPAVPTTTGEPSGTTMAAGPPGTTGQSATRPPSDDEADVPWFLIGGATGTVVAVAGVAALLFRSGDEDDTTGSGTDLNDDADASPTSDDGASSTGPTPAVGGQLNEIEEALENARQARDDREYGRALSACQRAVDAAEDAREVASEHAPDRLDDFEARHEAARSLRREVQAERDAHTDVTDALDSVAETLDTVSDVLKTDHRKALDRLDDAAVTLDETAPLIEEYGFTDAAARQSRLRERLDELRERGEQVYANIPDPIPTTSRFSLSHDAIEKGDRLGSGGNADVYYATADTDDGTVELALKEPRMSGTLHTETVDRLLSEAETWQRLDDHDHVVSVVDYGAEPLPWIAMEYMDSGHLGERGPEMEFDQALWTAIATTKAVRHAHRRGVAHLDLKPENVLLRSTGEDTWDVPKVADWGLSKHLLEHSKSIEGMSPHYAAPEQFDESYGPTDDVTDVYQLGAVFYELFTGRPPFEGRPTKVMRAVLDDEPPVPSEMADVPEALDEILLRALEKEKGDRYEDVLYLRDDLQDLLDSDRT